MRVIAIITSIMFLFHLGNGQCTMEQVFNNDSTNAVCIDSSSLNVLDIYSNSFPNHSWGSWPSNSPVLSDDVTYHVCKHPQKGDFSTSIYKSPGVITGCGQYIKIGIGLNGIFYSGWGARYFTNPNTMEENTDFNVEATKMFNMGFNNAHSNSAGEYHYHGVPIAYYIDSLKIDGSKHSPIIGYAADGYPMYYKYIYSNPEDNNSSIDSIFSGFTLKSGDRTGDGITEPDGPYDGLYVEDYEYTNPASGLDECNGRFGITPEYPNGTYYYMVTDNWPYFPRCFYGTVIDNSFRIGGNCPASTADTDCGEEALSGLEVLEKLALNIYPNPTVDFISITKDAELTIDAISIYDLYGKVFLDYTENFENMDLTSLPQGSYFMQIKAGEFEVTRKIIKQ